MSKCSLPTFTPSQGRGRKRISDLKRSTPNPTEPVTPPSCASLAQESELQENQHESSTCTSLTAVSEPGRATVEIDNSAENSLACTPLTHNRARKLSFKAAEGNILVRKKRTPLASRSDNVPHSLLVQTSKNYDARNCPPAKRLRDENDAPNSIDTNDVSGKTAALLHSPQAYCGDSATRDYVPWS